MTTGWKPWEIDEALARAKPVRPRERGTAVADVADVAHPPGEEAVPDLGAVLDELTAHIRRFVFFPRPEQAEAAALWCAHTHAIDAGEQSPILAVMSPVKRSGKSRLLDVAESVVRDPWRIERPSEAVLYRRIDRDRPSVLLDEADAVFGDRSGQHEGVRALLNAGNRRGTTVPRAVAKGRGFELIDFAIFCPKAVAGLGRFPETLVDRSMVIAMARRRPGERVDRLRARTAEALGRPIRERLEAALRDCPPLVLPDDALPDALDDRSQDNWESLIALADRAGGPWPHRARAAALALEADRATSDDNASLILLADMRTIFEEEGDPFLPTPVLIDRLTEREQSPWSEWRGGRPITARGIARLLEPLGVSPEKVRRGDAIQRGYARRAFGDAWDRYVPVVEACATPATPATPAPGQPLPTSSHPNVVAALEAFADMAPTLIDEPRAQEGFREQVHLREGIAWEQ